MARQGPLKTPALDEAVRREKNARRAEAAAGTALSHERLKLLRDVVWQAGGISAGGREVGLDRSTVSLALKRLAAQGAAQTPPAGRFLGPHGAERYEMAEQAPGAIRSEDAPRLAGLPSSAPPEEGDPVRRAALAEWSERLVPALIARAAEELPGHRVEITGLWAHRDRAWQWASPDRLLVPVGADDGYGVLECLALPSPLGSAWGTSTAPTAPEDVRARALWTADTLGADFALVVALGAGWDCRVVRIEHDPVRARTLRDAVTRARTAG